MKLRSAFLLCAILALFALTGCNLSNVAINCTPGSTIQACLDQFDAFASETKEVRFPGDYVGVRVYGNVTKR